MSDAAPSEQALYGPDLAPYYDLIYRWKDYRAEAERLGVLLSELGVAPGSLVLEAACGTGSYLACLRERYDVAGFDRNEAMLAVARKKLGDEVPLFAADMSEVDVEAALGGPADALLCLFSSIGYVPLERLPAVARAFQRGLRPGGALIVEPWLTPEAFAPGRATLHTYEDEQLKLARAVVSAREGRTSRLDFHWLVARAGQGVSHLVDRHELYLCEEQELLAAFRGAGFEARLEEESLMPGRGLLLARRA